MKRIIFNAFVAFCMYCLLYKLGFFGFFFIGGSKLAIAGICILVGIPFSSSISLHILLDHWVNYEQEIEFTIKEKKMEPNYAYSGSTNNDGNAVMIPIESVVCGYTYILIYSRKDAPEEVFEKDVRPNVYNSFEEGETVKVNKKRTIVATHYKVVREKSISI